MGTLERLTHDGSVQQWGLQIWWAPQRPWEMQQMLGERACLHEQGGAAQAWQAPQHLLWHSAPSCLCADECELHSVVCS